MVLKKTFRLTAAISIVLALALCIGTAALSAYAAEPPENEAIQSGQQADTNSRVIREGGVYYILCDGADESNKPASSVSDGSLMFVLVRKESCTSISGFDNLEKLVDDVSEQCNYMLKKQAMSQDEATLIVEAANKIQSGNDSDYIDRKEEASHFEEYAQWGIVKKNDAYCYKDERIRIFMDLRANNSFVTFKYDGLGTIDLKLIRTQDGSIQKAENLSQTETNEILKDLDIAHSSSNPS